MNIRILSVGKIKEQYLQQAISEYEKRLSGYSKIELITVPDERIVEKASSKEEENVKRKEGKLLLSKIKDHDYVILVDLHGEEYDSLQFAEYLHQQMNKGISSFTFVIGGSLGFSEEVIQRAQKRICLSKMTFTHQFAKLIIMEQIYRAFKILHHETYHK